MTNGKRDNDRINTPLLDLDDPDNSLRITSFRVQRLEQTVEKQSKDITETRETVVGMAVSVKEIADSVRGLRSTVHPCTQTAAIAEIKTGQVQIRQDSASRKARASAVVTTLAVTLLGLIVTASTSFIWAGTIDTRVANEIETRERDVVRIESNLRNVPSKTEVAALATREDLERLRTEIFRQNAGTQSAWFDTFTPVERRRFCAQLSEDGYKALPLVVRGGCREHR